MLWDFYRIIKIFSLKGEGFTFWNIQCGAWFVCVVGVNNIFNQIVHTFDVWRMSAQISDCLLSLVGVLYAPSFRLMKSKPIVFDLRIDFVA